MRWWLALAFALIASLTAVAVAEVFTERAEDAFRSRAEELTTGNGVAAASEVGRALRQDRLKAAVDEIAQRRRLALFVFADNGTLLTPARSRTVSFGSASLHEQALESALSDRRFVGSTEDGRTIAVGLPLRTPGAAALVAVASRPDLVAELGILRSEIIEAALLAVVIGALAGLLVAVLISVRLRRIASAAAAIERGSFETELRPGFRDELGELAATVDRMRERLRQSFTSLESERDRLRLLLEQLHEGVIAVDRELKVDFANRAAARFVPSLRHGEPLPEPWAELSLRRLTTDLFRPEARIVQARISPDEERTYALAGIPAGPGSELAVLVVADISERERRERAEREFVANAAHELRTPIAVIASAIDVLEEGAKAVPEDRDRFLQAIRRQTARLGRLVRALLVLARAQTRQQTLRLEAVELRPLLDEIAAELDPAEGVTVEVSCPAGLAVLGEPDLVAQVVANLAGNSAKHTERGRILLAARPSAHGSVLIEVSDTGSGIAQETQERVFDRFYTGDRERTSFGLGLAIVHEAVRALGGVIDIESQPGRGTTARVTLAGAQAEAA
jgi:signal transduction histidine kinase/HAMP domain-containing protein